MAHWLSLEDDREVSDRYAERHPDAVYDADDPEWWDILYLDDEDEADYAEESDGVDDGGDDRSEYDDDDLDGDSSFDLPDDGDVEYEWDDPSLMDDEGYYEVEIGIDYE